MMLYMVLLIASLLIDTLKHQSHSHLKLISTLQELSHCSLQTQLHNLNH